MIIEYSNKVNNTDYIEFQVCKADLKTEIKSLVLVKNISFNAKSSIYIDFIDYEEFFSNYGIYFNNGVHNNLEESELDPYGINYFSLDKTRKIIEEISKNKPLEYEKMIKFLLKAKDNNGFYILGI